ncbi:hypothetical protein SOVF_021830 [Spinacia oleracea]|nr:F-box/LRR-repeat protein At3g26922-like isoform X2 [Spinacia oleracea]KNA23806.1 hypothetical protein SOVF_021830 [Spinacia oleracea]
MAGMSDVLSSGEEDPSELNVDRISSLPWNVLDIILGEVSIIEAARTSVLAKDWQYKWLSISNLHVDYGATASALNKGNIEWEKFASIINRFLLHHSCTIRKFYLSAFCKPHYPDMYPWIQYLSTQEVEVLFLQELGPQQLFEVPSNLFSFKKLRRLYLGNCVLKLPSNFGGLISLREISFSNVLISDDDLHRMLRAYPLVEKLVLSRMPGIQHLRIYGPRLTMLVIDTNIEDIVIEEGAACLASVCIRNALCNDRMIRNWQSVIRCLHGLKALESLVLFGDFIKVWADDYNLETFPLRNGTMTHLSLRDVALDAVEVLKICLSLLRTCPNVKSFNITIKAAKGQKLFTQFLKENHGKFSFPVLNSISVTCPSGNSMECTMTLIEFLCANSPNIKVVSVTKGGKRDMNTSRVSRMLSRLRKICPDASVKYTYNSLL